MANIKVKGRNCNCGRFDNFVDAVQARTAAEKILHPFAALPRDVTPLYIRSQIRLQTIKTIVKAARRRGDMTMEWAAWQEAFATAC